MEFIKAAYMPFVYLIIGTLTASAAAAAAPEAYAEHPMLWTMVSALITIPLCICQMQKNGYLKDENPEKADIWDWILLGVLALAACIALNYGIELSGLMKLFPGFTEVSQRIYGGSLAEELLAVALAAPVVEELLFRGLVYRGWKRLLGWKMAFVLSALFFGIYHRNIVQGLYAFLIGLLLAAVYECFETVLAPIIFHVVANAVSVCMTECMDMEWVKRSVGTEMAFTLAFMTLGTFAGLLLYRRHSGRAQKT